MNERKKRKKISFKTFFISILVLALIALIADASYLSLRRLKVREVVIKDSKIPESFDKSKILIFSDIASNITQLKKVEKLVKQEGIELVVFLGNLTVDEDQDLIAQSLKDMDAPLGKFAVLSPSDYQNEMEKTKELLSISGFRIQENTSIKVYNKKNDPIQFVFLNSYHIDKAETDRLNESIHDSLLSISFTYNYKKGLNTPYIFASKYDSSKVNLPLISEFIYENELIKPINSVDGQQIYLSNGISTFKENFRLFSSPDIIIVELESSN